MDSTLTTSKKENILCVLRGVLAAISLTVVLILFLALIYKFVDMSEGVIKIVNQVIKVLSIAVGVFVCVKKNRIKGMLKGSIIGAIYTLTSYLLFSILISSFSFSLSLVYDIIFGTLIGLIFGVIFVNFRK